MEKSQFPFFFSPLLFLQTIEIKERTLILSFQHSFYYTLCELEAKIYLGLTRCQDMFNVLCNLPLKSLKPFTIPNIFIVIPNFQMRKLRKDRLAYLCSQNQQKWRIISKSELTPNCAFFTECHAVFLDQVTSLTNIVPEVGVIISILQI